MTDVFDKIEPSKEISQKKWGEQTNFYTDRKIGVTSSVIVGNCMRDGVKQQAIIEIWQAVDYICCKEKKCLYNISITYLEDGNKSRQKGRAVQWSHNGSAAVCNKLKENTMADALAQLGLEINMDECWDTIEKHKQILKHLNITPTHAAVHKHYIDLREHI